jgi:hypothetical protein
MGLAIRRGVSAPPTALAHFCRQVAGSYRINAAHGYPANIIDLRQYITADSDTYFPRIAVTVDEMVRDDVLRLCNHENLSRWRRLLSSGIAGAESPVIMIRVLESERLLIEHSCAELAFCFCHLRSAVCASIGNPAGTRHRPRAGHRYSVIDVEVPGQDGDAPRTQIGSRRHLTRRR